MPTWLPQIVALGALACAAAPCQAQRWEEQAGGTRERLRGQSVVDARVAWASGARGTVLRTVDGVTWTARPVPGAGELDFRDIHAVDARTAYVLAIGAGEKSRIFKTRDGGESWATQYLNRDPRVFLDALAFWDADHGLALGDPVDGRFTILATDDGGASWAPIALAGMPPALEGEGAFAASGTCLVVRGDRDAWFGTGGGRPARVFRSGDRGRTWTAHDTPIRAGSKTSGIFSLAFRDALRGIAVGGTYDAPEVPGAVAATTEDGGRTWILADAPGPGGFRSAAAYLGRDVGALVLAVGPSGSDLSRDGGRTWAPLGPLGFHAVASAGLSAWAVGEGGRIARYEAPVPR